MPRAKRYHITGYIWHITHRCHKREFLLKFARDRRKWISWLFEAKKRYGLSILNFNVTSNHIHLPKSGSGSELRERVTAYNADLGPENDGLSQNNGYFWNQNS